MRLGNVAGTKEDAGDSAPGEDGGVTEKVDARRLRLAGQRKELGHERQITSGFQGQAGPDYAGKWKDKPYRFLIHGNEFVSRV